MGLHIVGTLEGLWELHGSGLGFGPASMRYVISLASGMHYDASNERLSESHLGGLCMGVSISGFRWFTAGFYRVSSVYGEE